MSEINTQSSADSWDTELFSAGGAKTVAKDIKTASTNILNTEVKMPISSKQVKETASDLVASVKSAFTIDIKQKPILSPTVYQSHLPEIAPTKALVPIAGIALAVLIIWGGQKLSPLVQEVSLAPDNFSIGVFSSLVVEPTSFLIGQVASVPASLENISGNLSLSGLTDWLNKPVLSSNKDVGLNSNQSAGLSASVVTSAGDTLSGVWGSISNFFQFYKELIFNNWLAFIFGDDEVEDKAEADDLRAQIKADVLAELRGEIDQIADSAGSQPIVTTSSTGQGLVVVPVNGGESSGEVAQKIGGLFSDPVTIRFDQSGQAGIITPEFKRTADSSDYVFVLTPIRHK